MFGRKQHKIPAPVTKGVVRVPLVMQMENTECGAAALAMILHYYHQWIPLEQIRIDCDVSSEGVRADHMLDAARGYGLKTRAWRMEPEGLLKEGPFPCILHWGFNHFVVLCGFHGNRAVICDPARGRVRVEWEEFDREFTGVCLCFEPGETFIPSGSPRTMRFFVREWLRGARPAIVFLALAAAVSCLLGIVRPAFSRTFLDRLLSGKNPDWLESFFLLFLLFACASVAAGWISSVCSLRIEGGMAVRSSTAFLWKLLHLPLPFFSQRNPADIANRHSAAAAVSGTLVRILAPLAIQTAMMVFYLAVMIRYSLLLALIGAGAVALNMIMSFFVTSKRVNIMRVQQRDAAGLSSATVSGISMIETIKSAGAENAFFARWVGYQANVNAQSVAVARLNNLLGSVPAAVTSLANTVVLGLGVLLVVRGRFTVGMIMAFQALLSSFLFPAIFLITAGQSVQEMITHMERINDVMNYPDDPLYTSCGESSGGQAERDDQAPGGTQKLSGKIELRDVTFGYSRLGTPIIRDLSLTVKPGQRIAIVGKTGSGKSTLARLIAGLYQPRSGSVLFDGRPLGSIGRDQFIHSLSFVNQDTVIFEDSVSRNISMWDSTIRDAEIIRAARDAGICEEIMSREGGFSRMLPDGGRDLSAGQRQRLAVARALSRNPSICIMDEAFSALDSETERKVLSAVFARNMTCIMITHRLSTIRDCDQILVLDNGRIVDCGTHTGLLSRCGLYAELAGGEGDRG